VTRGDNGSQQPNFSRLLGSFSSAAISETYRGRKNRGVGLVASTGAFHLGSYAADSVLREFFFRSITSKLPGYQKNPPSHPSSDLLGTPPSHPSSEAAAAPSEPISGEGYSPQ
jgi:hypothetical protein